MPAQPVPRAGTHVHQVDGGCRAGHDLIGMTVDQPAAILAGLVIILLAGGLGTIGRLAI